MAHFDEPRRARPTRHGWIIAAAALWVIAVVLVAVYLWGGGDHGPEEAGLSSSVSSGAGLSSTSTPPSHPTTTLAVSITTSEATTTTTMPSTTTTQPPALLVAAGGDVLGDRQVGYYIDDKGGALVFARVKPLLAGADVSFVNLEGPISDKGSRATWKKYTFRARPGLLDGLLSAGVNVVSLANNHSVDYGASALLDTIERLDAAGMSHAGAGADAAAASAPALLDTPAGTVAVLAFTDIIPGGFTAGTKEPGVAATTPDRKKLLAAVKAANQKADFVIVSFHWGVEYDASANEDQRKLAHQVIDAGADLVLGHHPHVIEGLELYRNRLIAYSLGDFVFDHYSVETGEAFVLRVAMKKAGPPSAEIVPVYLNESNGVPSPVTGEHAASILERLARLSSDLGLQLKISGDKAFVGSQAPLTP